MKRIQLLAIALQMLIIIMGNVVYAQGTIQWQKNFGGTENDRAYAIQPTSDGGYIVAGESNSNNVDFTGNHGGIDYRVVKLDASGNITWQKNYGGSGNDIAKCIRQTSDGGYIVVGVSDSKNGDITNSGGGIPAGWVLKLDNAGAKSWDLTIQGRAPRRYDYINTQCAINTVVQTDDGGYLLGGDDYTRDQWIDPVVQYAMIVKLDGNSEVRRSEFVLNGTVTSIVPTSIGYTATGFRTGYPDQTDIFVAGFDFSGNVLWESEYGGSLDDKASSIQKTVDGGYIVAGTSSSIDGNLSGSGNHGDADYWLLKLNNAYAIEWSKCFGGSGPDTASTVQQMADGSFIIAGTSFSSDGQVTDHNTGNVPAQSDGWVNRVSNAGNFIWGKSYGGNANDKANALEKTTDGKWIIAGASASTNPGFINKGKDDYWILKLAIPASVSNGVPGSCTTFPPITINSSNNNQWVSIIDNEGNAVAEIKANGNNLGLVNASMFINNGAVREDGTGRLYLDRTITIKSQFAQHSPVDVRLYIKGTEFSALKNAHNSFGQSSGISSINNVGIFQPDGSCAPVVTAVSHLRNTTGEPWRDDYVLSTSINYFSTFCFASKNPCAAPVISQLSVNPTTLWPANHQMVTVTVNYQATGNCFPITSQLTVTSNEPVTGTGPGDLSPDWVVLDDHHVQLRAERAAQCAGRIYTITVNAKNAFGTTCRKTIRVTVPLQQPGLSARSFIPGNETDGNTADQPFDCRVMPNPSNQYFELQVTAASAEKIEVNLLDMSGRLMEKINTVKDKTTRFGDKLKPGMYMVLIRQGLLQKTIKVVKQ